MANPDYPEIETSYTAWQQAQQDSPFPGTALDGDLANLKAGIDGTIDALKDVRRADGKLPNGLVDADALDNDLLIGLKTPVAWESGARYVLLDTVYVEGADFYGLYRCDVSHESSLTFQEDLDAGYWELIFDFGGVQTASIAARDKAREWATNPEDDPVETDPTTEYSALHHATKADASAAAASASASAAGSSATAAATSADEAAASAGTAEGAASTAQTSAGQAMTAANNAATSETNAAASADEAADSATAAAASADQAETTLQSAVLATNNGSDFEDLTETFANMLFLQSGTGAVARSANAKLAEFFPTPQDFNAVGDSVADDTTAVSNLIATGRAAFLPEGTYATTLALTDVTSPLRGQGQIELGTGNRLPPNFNYIDAAPAALGNHQSFSTAFNGDLSKSFIQAGFYLTGIATLGQPATGFRYNEELSPIYIYMRNMDGGHNEQTDGNDGRTTWIGSRIRGFHSGLGGMMGYSSSIFVNGIKPGATTFLASPAAACFNGEAYGGADGVYLNVLELNCNDQGYDVAAIGPVINMIRTNKTGALEAFWAGVRIQSVGTEPINSAYQLSGKADTGLDFTKADFTGPAKAAIALKADDRIYFEASSANNWHKTANGDTFMHYNSVNLGLAFHVDGSEILRLKGDRALVRTVSLAVETGNLSILNNAAVVAIGGNKVLGARQPDIADASAGTEIATINSILNTMRTHGFISS